MDWRVFLTTFGVIFPGRLHHYRRVDSQREILRGALLQGRFSD
jgi:hypothetical protein